MPDQLLQMMERSDREGVRELLWDRITGRVEAWETHLSLFTLVQRVQNPPFINPHLPKMYRIIREFLPYLQEDEIPPLVRLEISEYTRRPKSAELAKPSRKAGSVSFPRIESAIREGEREHAAAAMLAFLEQEGTNELARRLLLLGSGYLNHSLGHSVSCTAFILLEMLERRDQDPWPVLATMADYFCAGRFHTTPKLRKPEENGPDEALDRHLLRATSGYGIVNLHHTITCYAVERVRHLMDEDEYAHMVACWVEFLGGKAEDAPPMHPPAETAADYEGFIRLFSSLEEGRLLPFLAGMIQTHDGRLLLGRYLIKGVCDLYQEDYNPHHLTGLGAALWVVDRCRERPSVAMSALRQYLNYYFTEMGR